jgi:hypothetical protein
MLYIDEPLFSALVSSSYFISTAQARCFLNPGKHFTTLLSCYMPIFIATEVTKIGRGIFLVGIEELLIYFQGSCNADALWQ